MACVGSWRSRVTNPKLRNHGTKMLGKSPKNPSRWWRNLELDSLGRSGWVRKEIFDFHKPPFIVASLKAYCISKYCVCTESVQLLKRPGWLAQRHALSPMLWTDIKRTRQTAVFKCYPFLLRLGFASINDYLIMWIDSTYAHCSYPLNHWRKCWCIWGQICMRFHSSSHYPVLWQELMNCRKLSGFFANIQMLWEAQHIQAVSSSFPTRLTLEDFSYSGQQRSNQETPLNSKHFLPVDPRLLCYVSPLALPLLCLMAPSSFAYHKS